MKTSWSFAALLAGCAMISCTNSSQPNVPQESTAPAKIWVSYFYIRIDDALSMDVLFDGRYYGYDTSAYEEPLRAKTFEGRLDDEQIAKLSSLLSEELFAIYGEDSFYSEDDLESCEVGEAHPVVHQVLWKELIRPNYEAGGFGCWPDEPKRPETREMVRSFQALAQSLAEEPGGDGGSP